MGKDKCLKSKKRTRKIQDLPAKGKRAAAVKGGSLSSGGDRPTESLSFN